ncbi:MAG: protein kinase [Planctomycetota bacterium]
MSSDAETRIHWTTQLSVIRQRFEEALRAGETIESLDAWLQCVPEHLRPKLSEQLKQCVDDVGHDSIETRILASDAAIDSSPNESPFLDVLSTESESAVDRCPTFRGLSEAAVEDLEERLVPSSFASGSELLKQGEPARGLYLILSGSVDIVDVATGERIDCDGAGSVLGEMSLLTGAPCSAEVIAVKDVEALVLSTKDYELLVDRHPELEIALSQLVSDRLGGRKHDALCGKRLGNYKPIHCISRGGMGVVYEAESLIDHQRVALKMLRHRFIYDDAMQHRFDQEAKLLENLVHPNVVRFQEHFLAYRTRFLVLDLCNGSDLFRLLRVKGPMPEETVRAILGQIAKGLLNAHQSGVVHRDLKPGNVLVDREGNVRLTDFGLSKLLESEIPEGKAVGTPAYMPPEQFRNEPAGSESDWYSLGCLIYEMLTARMLFTGDDWTAMYNQKRDRAPGEDWPEFDSSQGIDCSDELFDVMQGALQPQRNRRKLDLEHLSTWAAQVDGLFN